MAVTDDPRLLVEAYKLGDADAFDEIVHQYYEGLFAHALRRLGTPQAAEDAVQETLVRAYRGLPRFNGEYRLRGWLHKILTNVCHDEGSRRQREMRTLDRLAGSDIAHDAPPADDRLDRLDVSRRELVDALSALPESYRQAIMLRYVDDLSFHEVAEATGVTEGNARLRVHRGRAALKRALGTSLAALGWLIPMLRRAERDAVAEVAGRGDIATAATAATAIAASPATNRAAEMGVAFGDKFPSFAQLFGVAATVMVPAAVPVVSDHVANRMERPAAVASPLEVAAGAAGARSAAAGGSTGSSGSGAKSSTGATSTADSGTTPGSTTGTADGGAGSTSGDATGTAAPTSSTDVPGADGGTVDPAPSDGTGRSGAPAPAADPQPQTAGISSDELVAVTDWRTELSGSITLAVGDEQAVGTLYGTIETGTRGEYQSSANRRTGGTGTDGSDGSGDGTYESAAAPRDFTGELVIRLDGGRSLRVLLAGTLEDTADGATTIAGTYRLLDGCGAELGTGDAGGLMRIEEAPVASSLHLDLARAATELAALTSSDTCQK